MIIKVNVIKRLERYNLFNRTGYGVMYHSDDGIYTPFIDMKNDPYVYLNTDDDDTVYRNIIGIPIDNINNNRFIRIDRVLYSSVVRDMIYVEEFLYNIPNSDEWVIYAIRVSGWKLGKPYRRVYAVTPNCNYILKTLSSSLYPHSRTDIYGQLSVVDILGVTDELYSYDDGNEIYLDLVDVLNVINYDPALVSDVMNGDTNSLFVNNDCENPFDEMIRYLTFFTLPTNNNMHINYINHLTNTSYTSKEISSFKYMELDKHFIELYNHPDIGYDDIKYNDVLTLAVLDNLVDLMASVIDAEYVICGRNDGTNYHEFSLNYVECKYDRIDNNKYIDIPIDQNVSNFIQCVVHCIDVYYPELEVKFCNIRVIKTDNEELFVYVINDKFTTLFYYDIIKLTLRCVNIFG